MEEFSKEIKENNEKNDWDKIRTCLTTAAAKICGKCKMTKKQIWMTEYIMEVMEERCNFKHDKLRYAKSSKEIRKLCCKAKKEYHESLCKEIEELDSKHNTKAYDKMKKLTTKRINCNSNIADKDGNKLTTEKEMK